MLIGRGSITIRQGLWGLMRAGRAQVQASWASMANGKAMWRTMYTAQAAHLSQSPGAIQSIPYFTMCASMHTLLPRLPSCLWLANSVYNHTQVHTLSQSSSNNSFDFSISNSSQGAPCLQCCLDAMASQLSLYIHSLVRSFNSNSSSISYRYSFSNSNPQRTLLPKLP